MALFFDLIVSVRSCGIATEVHAQTRLISRLWREFKFADIFRDEVLRKLREAPTTT